jgi:hypothetical protein
MVALHLSGVVFRNPIVAAVRARSVRCFSRRRFAPFVTRHTGTLSGLACSPTHPPSPPCGPSRTARIIVTARLADWWKSYPAG